MAKNNCYYDDNMAKNDRTLMLMNFATNLYHT